MRLHREVLSGFLCIAALAASFGDARAATKLRVTMPSRMVNTKTLTLKAEMLDPADAIDWRTWSAYGTVSARRVADASPVPISITYFEDHAGIPTPDSIRFYNGVGSVSITLDNGACEPAGPIEVTVTVQNLAASKVVMVLDHPPMLNLSGTLSGASLDWGPEDGVIHLTGNISWGSGDLVIHPGTLVMADTDVDIYVTSNQRILATGTRDEPIFFFPAAGPEAMVLPNVCTQCESGTRVNTIAWGQVRVSGSGHSVFEHVFFTGGGNGPSEGHTRSPFLRFTNSSSFDLRDSVIADTSGKAVYADGNGAYTILRSLITRCGHGTEFTGSGYTLNVLDSYYTGVGRGPGTISCNGTTYDCGYDGDLMNPRTPGTILIKGNILTDGGDEAVDNASAQLTLENNIIYNVRDTGYTDDGSPAAVNVINCLIFNNGASIRGARVTLRNSTLYGGGQIGACCGSLVEESILWPQSLGGCPAAFNYNVLGPGNTASCGTGNVQANPLFVNASGPQYDFNPQALSPAVTAGPTGGRVGWLGFPAPHPCSLDAECADASQCTTDSCVAGACSNDPIAGCIPCGAEADCLLGSECPGECISGVCVFGGSCDDGLACTEGDTCASGQCIGIDICGRGHACDPTVGACVVVPTIVSFQVGVNGYAGTQDTHITQQFPDEAHGSLDWVEWDGQQSTAPPGQGMIIALIRFDGIFGDGPDQVPAGTPISSATLNYNILFNGGDDGELREALVDWGESITWDTLGPQPGPQAEDYGPIIGYAPGPQEGYSTISVNVTDSLNRWSANPALNKGWILIPTGTNGAELQSSEYAADLTVRPKLTIVYGGSGGGTAAASLPNVIRQPYLQKASPTSMTIVWRTDVATDSRVRFGTTSGALDRSVVVPGAVKNHVVTLTGLSPETTYYYDVGSSTLIYAGGCDRHWFTTQPLAGSPRPFTAWLTGCNGGHTIMQFNVRRAMERVTGSDPPDLMLHTGDIAYENCTENDLTLKHFTTYRDILGHTVSYLSPGNHEIYSSGSGSQSGPYYDAVVNPTAGESGGLPSGTEAYYSFDYANAHFIGLDTSDSSLSPGSPMLVWLQQDLAATTQPWIIAFFHHAPYSKGSHDSDNAADSGGRSVATRENVVPVLEAGGTDLVVTAHTHLYERSYLIDGVHGYGTAPNWVTPPLATLQADGHILNGGDGNPASGGAYVKPPGRVPHAGTVYVTGGHGGRSLDAALGWHPVMYSMQLTYGSILLDFQGNRLTYRNVREDGQITDTFTIVKPCASNSDCEDGSFCNGQATCVSGNCVAGNDPCPARHCNETLDACVDCLTNGHCDDGIYCDGAETCGPAGTCLTGTPPCAVGTTCNEQTDRCEAGECANPSDCSDGSLCTTDDCVAGSCTHVPSGLCSVSGLVRYYRNGTAGEPSAKPVPGAPIDVTEDGVPDAATAAGGSYMVGNRTGAVTVTALNRFGSPRAADHNGAVSSFDAAAAAQFAVGSATLSANQQLAADVTGNGEVSSFDAARIAQFAVELIDHFPVATTTGSDWCYLRCDTYLDAENETCGPPVFTHTPIAHSETDNFYAVLYGDVTGSWEATAFDAMAGGGAGMSLETGANVLSRNGRWTAPEERAAVLKDRLEAERRAAGWQAGRRAGGPGAKVARLSLSGWTGSLPAGERRQVVVQLDKADGIEAFDLDIAYDSERARIVEVHPTGLAASFALESHDRGGKLALALYGVDPLMGSGAILTVTIEARKRLGGGAPFSVCAVADEGRIELENARHECGGCTGADR